MTLGLKPIPTTRHNLVEGKGHVYILAFLVAQGVKNLPAMWETWVRSLSREDPLEEVK